MPSTHLYANAPITEALIDIQVELASGTTVSNLESVFDQIKANYPIIKNRISFKSEVTVGEELGASAKQKHDGFAFYSADGKQIMQARLDGFTFNRLKPYDSWPVLRDEARILWGIYCQCAKPIKVTRIAVRYINRIDIPLPIASLNEYLRTVLEISPDLPQTLSNFNMRLEFPQTDFDCMVVLTQFTEPLSEPGIGSVILDIDVIKQGSSLTSDPGVWEHLEKMRIVKNKFFEGCITDEARALFGLGR